VDEACARASAAVVKTQEDSKAAKDDKRQARDIAAAALRDGRQATQAQASRETDYFYQSNQAWVLIQKVITASQAARSSTK
jgi:hypothetical protein